ncbi:MAG: indole-3-glycerol phosphate synthase TrpC [Brevinematia bacterium]
MSVLDKILEKKFLEVEERKKQLPIDFIFRELDRKERIGKVFYNSLKDSVSSGKPGLIAEIKFASPSKGVIRSDLTPERVASIYDRSEYVDCISVLTERYFFNGDISFLGRVKSVSSKPILRKDFIVDSYQIYESAYYGADCILIIAGCLEKSQIKNFLKISKEINLDVLVELYDEEDVKKVDGLDIEILGINSRNLKTLEISLEHSLSIISKLSFKPHIFVAESGIKTKRDVIKAISFGFNSFLIGEAFMSSENISTKIEELMKGIRF